MRLVRDESVYNRRYEKAMITADSRSDRKTWSEQLHAWRERREKLLSGLAVDSGDTLVRVFAEDAPGSFSERVTRLEELPDEGRNWYYNRFPICPCGKSRFDAYRGLNKCPQCATVADYAAFLTPFLQEMEQVAVEINPTGKSLLVRAADSQFSFRLKAGILKGAKWDEQTKALVAGKVVLERAWGKLQRIPRELVAALAETADRFGVAVEAGLDGQSVFFSGEWLVKLLKEERQILGEREFWAELEAALVLPKWGILRKVPKKKNRYFVRSEDGVEAALQWFEMRLVKNSDKGGQHGR